MHAPIAAMLATCFTGAPSPATQPTPAPYAAQSVSYLPRTAAIIVGGKTWTFQPGPNNHGLRLKFDCDENARMIDLGLDGIVGEVIGIDAATREPSRDQFERYIGLVLECKAPDGKSRQYRMAFGRWPAERSTAPDKGYWIASSVLIARPDDDPFNAASVSLIGGDSMMVTLQKLTRASGDQIETDVFVNHCPVGNASIGSHEMMQGITTHYTVSPANHAKTPAAQPK